MNNLKQKYNKEVVPQIMKEFDIENVMAVPKPIKVSLNVGLSRAASDPKFTEEVEKDLRSITGQAPVITKARLAIAGFKIRQNQDVGIKVTLRGERMWDFIERFVNVAIPRIRDFQGMDRKCFDNQGNLNYPIKEQLVFPEISSDNVNTIFGLQINIHIGAKDRKQGMRIFKLMGFPIKEEEQTSEKK